MGEKKENCKVRTCHMLPLENGMCLFHKNFKNSIAKEDDLNPYHFKSEIKMRKYIWQNREHRCFVTGKSLNRYAGTGFYSNLFMHILAKRVNAFPGFKLYINNVILAEPDVHELFDKGSLDQIFKFEEKTGHSFAGLFELEENLYNEYVSKFGKRVPLRKIVTLYKKRK